MPIRIGQNTKAIVAGMLIPMLATSSACYRYVPSSVQPRAGAHIELKLKREVEDRFRARGVNFVSYFTTATDAFDGTVLDNSHDSLIIQIASVRTARYSEHTLYQHITIAYDDIERIRRRTLNVAASAAMFGAGGAVLSVLVIGVLNVGSSACQVPPMTECRD